MTKEKYTEVINKHENIVVASTYNILFTNDIVCSLLIESLELLKKTDFFKFKTKQISKQLDNERKRYEKVINQVIGSDKGEFFADANDKFIDNVSKDINTLLYSIKQEMDKNHLDNTQAISKLELCRTLCELSCIQHEMRMNDLIKTDSAFRLFDLSYLKLTNMLRLLEELFLTLPIKTVDLNTKQCKLALNIVSTKLSDVNIIANAIKTE